MSDLTFISPFFIVADLRESVDFYVEKLGFKVLYIAEGEDPYFAMLGRGQVSVMLKSSGQPLPNHTRYEWAVWDAHIGVAEPDALFAEFSAKGVNFNQPLQDNTDNIRGFSVTDPNGYRLFFGRPNA
ncbi:VOC family protein [Dyadobacter sp. MSC1_007]|jgi:catechol 2,3-dioxygenase-like lactoylglutathione lyase family enzyme|uniref:VOC family protein n=1 Tax=Dyadobacter sp. MSC1_007 TaxID=2909264 RepID=UPI00202FAC12|nr:VOC family protein [Dyadobacter sp. MSC1_007]